MEAFLSRGVLQHDDTSSLQVVSFGAGKSLLSAELLPSPFQGFDTLFFRLRQTAKMKPNHKFFEVDFPELIRQKCCIIEKEALLHSQLGDGWSISDGELDSQNYHVPLPACDDIILFYLLCALPFRADFWKAFGCDLLNLDLLEEKLLRHNFDRQQPTLFLAEVSLTYLQANESDAVIKWSQLFCNSSRMFLLYEQVIPSDAFGKVSKTFQSSL